MMIAICKMIIKPWKLLKNDDSKLKNGEHIWFNKENYEKWWLTIEKLSKMMIRSWKMMKKIIKTWKIVKNDD